MQLGLFTTSIGHLHNFGRSLGNLRRAEAYRDERNATLAANDPTFKDPDLRYVVVEVFDRGDSQAGTFVAGPQWAIDAGLDECPYEWDYK